MEVSDLDADALPERDTVLDLGGCGLRIGVIPGGIVIANAVHFDAVVVGCALPRANRTVVARIQGFFFDGFGRTIWVAFQNDGGVAFRDEFSAARGFGGSRALV